MSKKVDYKKDFKELYMAETFPKILEVPRMSFFLIEGSGDPNGYEFSRSVEVLYGLSYAARMSHKSKDVPKGYYEYTVFPLEGVWDLLDYSKPSTDKSNFKYTLMIRQPDFITEELFHRFLSQVMDKRPSSYLDKIKFEYLEDGLNCQMLHVGSFDDEPQGFERMESYCRESGFTRIDKTHREIYLSDPRKTESSRLKTVLRFHVKPNTT